jgi:hypothetical protein
MNGDSPTLPNGARLPLRGETGQLDSLADAIARAGNFQNLAGAAIRLNRAQGISDDDRATLASALNQRERELIEQNLSTLNLNRPLNPL